jgi:hydroxyacylglutathione hydrolase
MAGRESPGKNGRKNELNLSLHVEQFRYGRDNLGYLIFGKQSAMAVDGGAWQEIIDFAGKRHLALLYVTHTHLHHDHTEGSEPLLEKTGARLIRFQELQHDSVISLDGEPVRVYRTPGHSIDSVCFHAGRYLLSGDTLFNGTIGNCFSGDLRVFYESIVRLMALPDDTIVFPGHDYVELAIAFCRHLDPDNGDINAYMSHYDPHCVYSLLRDERKTNPYLRFNDPKMIEILRKRRLPVETEWDRWQSLMAIEE